METVAGRVRNGQFVSFELMPPRSPETEQALEVGMNLGWDTARTP
jgi:hypothetical protein